MERFLRTLRDNGSTSRKLLIGFAVGVFTAIVCNLIGLPHALTNAIVIGTAAGTAYGL